MSISPSYHRTRTIFAWYWWGERSDPQISMDFIYHTGGSFDHDYYSNLEVDKLVDESAQKYDEAKAKTIYEQAYKIVMETGLLAPVMAPIVHPYQIYGLQKNVMGFQLYAYSFPILQDL